MAAPSGLPRAPLRPKGGTVSGIATVSIGETGMRQALADQLGAAVSGSTGKARYSLSRIAGGEAFAFVACLPNARAAGRMLRAVSERTGKGIALVAAGEAAEDQEALETVVCRRSFEACRHDCADLIRGSLSGRCLAEKGCDLG